MKIKVLIILLFICISVSFSQDSVSVFISTNIVEKNKHDLAKSFNKVKSNQSIKIYLKSKFNVYIYLMNQFDNKIQLIYKDYLIDNEFYEIPNDNNFIFEGGYSEEKLIFVMSTEPLKYIDQFFASREMKINDWWDVEENMNSLQKIKQIKKEEFIKIAGNIRASTKIKGIQISGLSPLILRYTFYVKY